MPVAKRRKQSGHRPTTSSATNATTISNSTTNTNIVARQEKSFVSKSNNQHQEPSLSEVLRPYILPGNHFVPVYYEVQEDFFPELWTPECRPRVREELALHMHLHGRRYQLHPEGPRRLRNIYYIEPAAYPMVERQVQRFFKKKEDRDDPAFFSTDGPKTDDDSVGWEQRLRQLRSEACAFSPSFSFSSSSIGKEDVARFDSLVKCCEADLQALRHGSLRIQYRTILSGFSGNSNNNAGSGYGVVEKELRHMIPFVVFLGARATISPPPSTFSGPATAASSLY